MDPSGKPLHTLTAAELRACAVEYRKMAARATAAGAAEFAVQAGGAVRGDGDEAGNPQGVAMEHWRKWKPLSELTTAELHVLAVQYRAMAATASSAFVMDNRSNGWRDDTRHWRRGGSRTEPPGKEPCATAAGARLGGSQTFAGWARRFARGGASSLDAQGDAAPCSASSRAGRADRSGCRYLQHGNAWGDLASVTTPGPEAPAWRLIG